MRQLKTAAWRIAPSWPPAVSAIPAEVPDIYLKPLTLGTACYTALENWSNILSEHLLYQLTLALTSREKNGKRENNQQPTCLKTPKALLVKVPKSPSALRIYLHFKYDCSQEGLLLALILCSLTRCFLLGLFTKCVLPLLPAPHTLLYPPGQHPPTYRPQVGFFCFVDVVIQGGEVVTRFHSIALASDHVGLADALAWLCRAAGKGGELVSWAHHVHNEPTGSRSMFAIK